MDCYFKLLPFFSNLMALPTFEAAQESLVPVGESYNEPTREPVLYLLGYLGCLAFRRLI
jgi:hypothetical protein